MSPESVRLMAIAAFAAAKGGTAADAARMQRALDERGYTPTSAIMAFAELDRAWRVAQGEHP
jgi:hypothetical protein